MRLLRRSSGLEVAIVVFCQCPCLRDGSAPMVPHQLSDRSLDPCTVWAALPADLLNASRLYSSRECLSI